MAQYRYILVHILTSIFEHDHWFFSFEDRSTLLQCRSFLLDLNLVNIPTTERLRSGRRIGTKLELGVLMGLVNKSTSLKESYCLIALPLLDERLDLFGGILLSRYAAAPQKLGFGAVLNRSGCVQVAQLLHYRRFNFIISTWLKGETTLVYTGIQE
ncbi:hypothetical protein B0H15DRAFT_800585 [Mycena belliarum]|uniref:Uncharacterized protein n=1 Tax=Mycena belliarum TaxID=1033014 RepID=A0AAD6U635_9AGAR|nr:hypothetical protein B0H15DRAFT_800583 [Mycena belliae]KAJ7089239.1 hypothetical protein B0H15DRAFT_800585 [Mycena belliae]